MYVPGMADSSLLVILPWRPRGTLPFHWLPYFPLILLSQSILQSWQVIIDNTLSNLFTRHQIRQGEELIHSSFLACPLWTLVRSSTCVPQSVDRGEAQLNVEWLAIQKEVVALELIIQTIQLYNPLSTTSLLSSFIFFLFLFSSIFCLYPIYCYNLCSQFNTCVPHLWRFLYISLHLLTSLLSTSLPLFNTLISSPSSYSPPPPSSNLKPQTSNHNPIPTIPPIPPIPPFTMPHKVNDSNSTLASRASSNDQVVATEVRSLSMSSASHPCPRSPDSARANAHPSNQSRPQTSGGRP